MSYLNRYFFYVKKNKKIEQNEESKFKNIFNILFNLVFTFNSNRKPSRKRIGK